MGIIREELFHENASIKVVEKEKGEVVAPYNIIQFEFYGWEAMTPSELIDLSDWMIKEGIRILDEYDKDGRKKK